jgi:hypothetical protein
VVASGVTVRSGGSQIEPKRSTAGMRFIKVEADLVLEVDM